MEWLNGKKTYLGVVGWGVVQLLMMTKPEWMDVLKVAEALLLTLTGVGLGHKLDKVS